MPQSTEGTHEWNKPTGENLTDQLNLSFMSMDKQPKLNKSKGKQKMKKQTTKITKERAEMQAQRVKVPTTEDYSQVLKSSGISPAGF